jgi:hypothetical protein
MKLSRIKALYAALFLLLLAGCEQVEQVELPHVFSGNEVPPEVMSQPRVVTVPPPRAAQNDTWMRLGDVPAAPKNFTPAPMIEQTKQEMKDDRAEADQLKQAADMPPPVVSPPVAQ